MQNHQFTRNCKLRNLASLDRRHSQSQTIGWSQSHAFSCQRFLARIYKTLEWYRGRASKARQIALFETCAKTRPRPRFGRYWNSRREFLHLRRRECRGISYTENYSLIFCVHARGNFSLWNISGKLRKTLQAKGGSKRTYTIHIYQRLVSSSKSIIQISSASARFQRISTKIEFHSATMETTKCVINFYSLVTSRCV